MWQINTKHNKYTQHWCWAVVEIFVFFHITLLWIHFTKPFHWLLSFLMSYFFCVCFFSLCSHWLCVCHHYSFWLPHVFGVDHIFRLHFLCHSLFIHTECFVQNWKCVYNFFLFSWFQRFIAFFMLATASFWWNFFLVHVHIFYSILIFRFFLLLLASSAAGFWWVFILINS